MGSVIVRTWFGDDDAWEQLTEVVTKPSDDGFLANVRFVDDRAYEGFVDTDLPLLIPSPNFDAIVSFIADETTLTTPDWPLLTVWVLPAQADDLRDHTPFRVIASSLWSVENNLNLANMDWEEFSGAVDSDGVFRGF